ncbi:MAG: serine hydrolase, partial [Pyrinomonadaceae bacterium]
MLNLNSVKRLLHALNLLVCLFSLGMAQSVATSDGDLVRAINESLTQTYKADEPGASVIVVKDGKVIFRKGYGMANLELGVPVEPDMVFR